MRFIDADVEIGASFFARETTSCWFSAGGIRVTTFTK
jgi:hypothetical protein